MNVSSAKGLLKNFLMFDLLSHIISCLKI